MAYINYRCRACNKIIAVEGLFNSSKSYTEIPIHSSYHPNCTRNLADDENVFADCISISATLVNDTVDIITEKE